MSPGYKNVLTVAMDYFVFQQIQNPRKLVLLLNDNIGSLSIIPTVKFTENNCLQTKVQYDKQLIPLKQSGIQPRRTLNMSTFKHGRF